MPSFPPPSAIKSARTLHQQALQSQRPSGVTISGKFHAGAVELGALEWIPTDGGTARGQRMTAHIFKTRLVTPPGQKTLIYHDGVEFKIQEIGGRNANDVAWVLRCVRWMD